MFPTEIDASQAWFWSERWQAMEREVDVEISQGRVRRFESGEELLDEMGRL